MNNTWKVIIAIFLLLIVAKIGYELGQNKGHKEGWIEGQEFISNNMVAEMTQYGVTHVDYEGKRAYLVPVPVETAKEIMAANA